MAIPIVDVRGLFTTKMVAVYKELSIPTTFLMSFFKAVESTTKTVSIAVKRGTETVAVDVHRYSEGNRNESTRTSQKMILPPLYHEYLTANEHELYDMVVTSLMEGKTTYFAELVAGTAEAMLELRYKIERACELQCAQVLETGIVQLASGDNIDFGRKAGSLVDKGGGNYWVTGTVDPIKDLENGAKFLREIGKAQGGTFDAIFGADALSDFLNNTIVKERADIRNYKLDDIRAPEMSNGATYHGQVSCGSYRVNIWAYPQVFENASAVITNYVNAKKVVMLPTPENTKNKLAFAAVPQLIGSNGKIPQKGRYLITEHVDDKQTAHEIHIKSAPVAVPVAIDQIYTVQVVA